MEEKEREIFKKAWCFLVRETAASRGFKARNIVIGETRDPERPKGKQETA